MSARDAAAEYTAEAAGESVRGTTSPFGSRPRSPRPPPRPRARARACTSCDDRPRTDVVVGGGGALIVVASVVKCLYIYYETYYKKYHIVFSFIFFTLHKSLIIEIVITFQSDGMAQTSHSPAARDGPARRSGRCSLVTSHASSQRADTSTVRNGK